ncbi:MAG: acyltransferase [Bacteroidetes bacterium]|nr:acyltransferase [Bacteroidota bacterium]
MWQAFSRFLMKTFGWKVEGRENLRATPKAVVAVVPHTSNWDFPLGLFTRWSIGQDIKFIAKSSLFKWPYAWIFRGLGGYPVDRSKRSNFVDAVVDLFDSKEKFQIAIAPEGTRSKVDKLRTGFYYIAKGANIPIIPTTLNYETKTVSFGKPMLPSEDLEADFAKMEAFFRLAKGKNPEFGYLHE